MTRFVLLSLILSATVPALVANPQQVGKLPLAVTETGVGPITKTTPANVAQLAELFPQFRVIPGVAYGEGDAFPTLRVMDGNTEILYVTPNGLLGSEGTIWNVVIKSDRVVYAGKSKVGSLFSEVFGNALPADCGMGVEEDFEKVVCGATPNSHVRLMFSGRSDRRDGGMPSLSVLAKWRLTTIWWYP